MYFHSILITILSPLRTLTLPGTYHCRHDGVSPRLFTLHESIHILSLLLPTTTKTVHSHVLLLHQYDRIVPCHLVRNAHRACISITSAPAGTRTVPVRTYICSATLFMQYRFQTINQQLHAPRQQALLRLLRLRSTNTVLYSLCPVKVVLDYRNYFEFPCKIWEPTVGRSNFCTAARPPRKSSVEFECIYVSIALNTVHVRP